MPRRRLAWVTAATAVAGASVVWTSASSGVAQAGAQADIRAEYDRAASLRDRAQGLALDVAETPTWLEGTSKFEEARRVQAQARIRPAGALRRVVARRSGAAEALVDHAD